MMAVQAQFLSKAPHSKLWGITGKGTTPHQLTDGAAFIPPPSCRVLSGEFYKMNVCILLQILYNICGVCHLYSVKKLDIIVKILYYYCSFILIR